MSLRKLTLLLIFSMSLGLTGVILVSLSNILENHFITQEKKDLYLSIHQVENMLENQIGFLDKTSNDWSNWDDTYRFTQDQNDRYIQDNLSPIRFKNLEIDLFILIDQNMNVIYSGTLGDQGEVSSQIPAEISPHLVAGDPLISPQDLSARHGLMVVDNNPMMIVAHPVLKTDATGPAHGMLLLGKRIDQEIENNLSDLLSISVDIRSIQAVRNNPLYAPALAYQPSEQEPYYVELVPEEVAAYAFLGDYFSQPELILRVSRIPLIYNNGTLVKYYLMVGVILTTIMFSVILFFLIEFYVIRRVSQLSSNVQTLGTRMHMNERVPVKGKDELSALAVKINQMLDALEQAQFRQIESEGRFKTLIESMDDVVFSIDARDRQINVFDKSRAPDATVPVSSLPDPNTLILQELKNQLDDHQELLNEAFQGNTVLLDWTVSHHGGPRHYLATLSPIYDRRNSGRDIVAVVGVSKDMTVNKKMEQDLRNRIDELAALLNISNRLLDHIEPKDFGPLICRLCVEQLGLDAAWMMVPSNNGAALVPSAQYGAAAGQANEVSLASSPGQPSHPFAEAFQQSEIVFLPSGADELGLLEDGRESSSWALIPLGHAEGKAAILIGARLLPRVLNADSLPVLNAFANLVRAAMQNQYLFAQVLSGRERLQAVSKRLVEIQEEERRKIALELHDEIGQALTGLRLFMDMVQSLPLENVKKQVEQSIEMINDMIARVRQMSLDLRPSILDDLGVIPALLWYFDRYTFQTGINVTLQQNNLSSQRFSSEIEITVYRVVQEALTNVARHAQVNSVFVRLWLNQATLGVQIEDNGCGFNQEEALSTYKSKGLLGMRERVGFLHGRLNITTQVGEGTCLTVEIPLSGFLERRRNDR